MLLVSVEPQSTLKLLYNRVDFRVKDNVYFTSSDDTIIGCGVVTSTGDVKIVISDIVQRQHVTSQNSQLTYASSSTSYEIYRTIRCFLTTTTIRVLTEKKPLLSILTNLIQQAENDEEVRQLLRDSVDDVNSLRILARQLGRSTRFVRMLDRVCELFDYMRCFTFSTEKSALFEPFLSLLVKYFNIYVSRKIVRNLGLKDFF